MVDITDLNVTILKRNRINCYQLSALIKVNNLFFTRLTTSITQILCLAVTKKWSTSYILTIIKKSIKNSKGFYIRVKKLL